MSDQEVEDSQDDDLSQKYNVDEILDKKKENGIKYLIKWEGYREEEASWEPIENLFGILEMIEEFEQNHTKKSSDTDYSPGNKKSEKQTANQKNFYNKCLQQNKPILTETYRTVINNIDNKSKQLNTQTNLSKSNMSSNLNGSILTDISNRKDSNQADLNINNINKSEPITNINHIEQATASILINQNPNGDTPIKIINSKLINNEISCFIEWKVRANGVIPENSYVNIDYMRDYYNMLLLDYLESKIKYINKK